MRNAETILGVISERGRRRLPLEDIYRQLFNRDLFLRAYGRIYHNDGAMTPGATSETVDAMSLEKIDAIIEMLRHERYRWTPVRRTYIPKKSGKLRPLGIPTWSDKLLQEIVLILERLLRASVQPTLPRVPPATRLPYRPRRDHPSLERGQVVYQGDIFQCFDRIDHPVLLSILNEKLYDQRFLRLLANLLDAGYLEDWKYHATLSGSPQGSVVSDCPIRGVQATSR